MIKITKITKIRQLFKYGERRKPAYRGRKPQAFVIDQGKYRGIPVRTIILNRYDAYMIEVETNGRGYKARKVR